MQLRQSSRTQARIKLALQGCAGSGKTYSSLLLAYGLTNDWSKIAVIDTENGSADLYAHLGGYNVLPLQESFTPEKYIEAIGDLYASQGNQSEALKCYNNVISISPHTCYFYTNKYEEALADLDKYIEIDNGVL